MKKSRITRIIGTVICLALVLVMIPVSSFADDSELTIDSGDTGSAGAGTQDGELTLDQSTDGQSSSGDQDTDEEGELTLEDDNKDNTSETDDPSSSEGTAAQGAAFESYGLLPTSGTVTEEEFKEAQRLNVVTDITSATSTSGQPTTVNSGEAATMNMVLTYNRSNTGATIDPLKLKALITIPEGVEEHVIGNTIYRYEREVDSQTKNTIITLQLNESPAGGSGTGFAPMTFTIPEGVTDHNVKYPITVVWYYGDEKLFDTTDPNVKVEEEFEFTSVVKKFEWSTLFGSLNTDQVVLEGDNNNKIQSVIIDYAIKNEYSNEKAAISYTESLIIEDTITISDKLILNRSQIGYPSEIELVDVVENNGRVESFKFRYTKTNSATDSDLSVATGSIKIILTGIEVDDDAVKAAMASGAVEYTINDAIKSGNANAVITPMALLDGSAPENKATDTNDQGRPAQKLNAASAYSLEVKRSYKEEEPLKDAPSGKINMRLAEIYNASGILQTGRQYVYPGDSATYEIYDFGNSLSVAMDKLQVVYTFDNTEMYPTSVYTGVYNNYNSASSNMQIKAYIGDDTEPAFTATYRMGSGVAETIEIKGNFDNKDLSKVVFEYPYPPAKFELTGSRKPSITMKILDNGKPNTEFITNQADLVYFRTIDGKSVEHSYDRVDSSVITPDSNNYRKEVETAFHRLEDEEGSGVGKTWTLIRRKNPGTNGISVGDLLEYELSFTVEVDSEEENPYQDGINPFVDDTYKGQEPYFEDTENRLQSYGDLVKVVSVTDKNGRDVTEQRALKFSTAYAGPDTRSNWPTLTSGMMRISFDSTRKQTGNATPRPYDGHLQEGDVIVVTYVMKVSDPTKLENEYQSYSWYTGSGSPKFMAMGRGKVKPNKDDTNVVKPTLLLESRIRHLDGSRVDNNKPADKDEILDVTFTITNNSPSNAMPVNIAKFRAQYTPPHTSFKGFSFNDSALKAAKISYLYKPGENPDESIAVNITSASTSTPEWQLGSYIELAPGQQVTLTYQMKVNSWCESTSNFNYFYNEVYLAEEISYYAESVNDNMAADASNVTTAGTPAYRSRIRIKDYYYISKSNFMAGFYMASVTKNVRTVDLNEVLASDKYIVNNTLGIHNYGDTFDLNTLIVRLPKYESIAETNTVTIGSKTYPVTYKSLGYTGTSGDQQQVVAITFTTPYAVPKSTYGVTYSFIEFQTEIAGAHMDAINSDLANKTPEASGIVQLKSKIEIAFQSQTQELVDGNLVSGNSSSPVDTIAAVTDRAYWGGSQLPFTGTFYRATTEYIVNYDYKGPAPGLEVSMLKKLNNTYTKVSDSVTYNPGDNIAYNAKVSVENNYNSYLSSMQAPILVVRLANGTTFDVGAYNSRPSAYSGMSLVFQGTVGEHDYVMFTNGTDPIHHTAQREYFIPVTVGSSYGTKRAEFYLLTYDPFFAVRTGGRYGERILNDLPTEVMNKIPVSLNREDLYQYAVWQEQKIDVTGQFGFTTTKQVTVGNQSTNSSNNSLTTPARDNQKLEYRLELSNRSFNSSYSDVVLIERLPGKGDLYLMDPVSRLSNTKVVMTSAPVVWIRDASGVETKLAASKYTLEYANADPDTRIVGKDFGLTEKDAGIPSNINNWATLKDYTKATMFRVSLKVDLEMQQTLVVTFDATAPSDTLPTKDAVAVNTFGAGFKANTGTRDVEVYPEADTVKVYFPDVAPMIVKGMVFNDLDGDGIYNAANDTPFNEGNTWAHLYLENAVSPKESIVVKDGAYEFAVYDPGTYYVELTGIPEDYEIYDTIVSHEQGNKFYQTGKSVTMTYVLDVGATHIRNAAIAESVDGTLTIEKKMSGLGGTSVGGTDQKFVFRIDYTETNGTGVTQTFYEVIKGQNARVFTDLPKGTYVVTEVTWATSFEQVGTTEYPQGNQIGYGSKQITAVITNERDRKEFLHAIDDQVNVFPKEN